MTNPVHRLNPTELPTGKRHEQIVELRLPSVLPFDMVRLYRTGQDLDGPLGRDQLAGVDITLRDGGDGTYIYTDLSGIPLPLSGPEAKPGAQSQNNGRKELRLEPLPRSGFRVRERNIQQDFALYPGRIWRMQTVSDQHGNTIVFERDPKGVLLSISLADGLKLEFQNDQSGLRRGYDLVAPEGQRLAIMRYDYDAAGRLILADNHVGAGQAYTYDDGRQLVQTIDDLANVTSHFYDDQGRVVRIENDAGYHNGQFIYHDDRSQVTVLHGDGREFEKLWFDDAGRHFMAADALGGFSYRAFDGDNQLIGETDQNGHKTRFRTDPMGNPEAQIDPEGRERFLIWNDAGNILVEKDPAGNAWRFRYGDDGTLEQSQSPLGHVTNYRYDARGRLTQRMRHDGLIEFQTYDANGRLVSHIDYNSAETKITHDCFGRVATVTDAHQSTIFFTHDDTIKGKPFHMPSSVTRADGATIQRQFFASGDLKSVTDGDGRKTSYQYGPYNVIQGIEDARGNALRFQYDSRKRLTCVTNQSGRHWQFARDVAGRVVSETDFDGRTINYTYDPAGRMIRRQNPDGACVTYTYDKGGLMRERRAQAADGSAPLISSYVYDDAGELIGATNADATVALERDALGTVVAETVNGVTIESDFDCCGNRIARRFDGLAFVCQFDGMGNLKEWALEGQSKLTFTRDLLGQELSRKTRDGFVLQQSWDSVGQLTQQTASDAVSRSYAWSKASAPTEIKDAHAGSKRFNYDPNGQIEQIKHGDGGIERFAYAANMTIAATADDSQFMNWQTSAAGVAKIARGPLGEVVTLEHDENGRVIQRTVTHKGFRPQTWRFSWNALDQLARVTCPDGIAWTYRYDPFGRRIAKESKDTLVTFIWDGEVVTREITRTKGNTRTVDWFYEPDSFRPLARLEDGILSYVITDYLGTPKELVGSDGALHWRADHATWGALRPARNGPRSSPTNTVGRTGDYWIGEGIEEGAQAPAYDTTQQPADAPDPVFCPIRFQGQWEDAETGLYYNRYRYYDPLIGSYTSPDPIGVNGGPRPDAYVIWPHILTDPFGLNPCCAAKYRRNRPCFRNGVVESVWNAAVERAQARGLDYIQDVGQRRIPIDSWQPGQSRIGVWDMGHDYGHEYRTELLRLERGEITPTEFRDNYNTAANYRVEHPTTNRSHAHEQPDTCEP